MPVFGGTLTFTYQDGALRAADGSSTRIRIYCPRLGGGVHLLRRRADADFGEPRRARLGRQPDHRHAAGLSALRDGHLGPPLHAGLARRDGHGRSFTSTASRARSVRPNEARLRSTLSNLNRILRKLLLDCHFFFTLTRRCGILSRWPELAALVCIATAERRASANTDFGAKPQIIPVLPADTANPPDCIRCFQ